MKINMTHLRERTTLGGWIDFAVFDEKFIGMLSIPKSYKPIFYSGLLILVMLVSSGCQSVIPPNYDPQTASQVTDTYKAIAKFYIVLHNSGRDKRSYTQLSHEYDAVAVQIKTLIWRSEQQANNKQMIGMAKQLLLDWNKIEDRNKKTNKYSNIVANIDQERLDGLLSSMAEVESFENKSTK